MGEGFNLWSLDPMAWEGREPLWDWIYLSVSAFSDSTPSPFRLYLEIRNSDWIETFAQIFFQKLAFLRPKKGINRLTGGPRGSGARPGGRHALLPRGHLRHRLAWFFLPKNHIYSKKISVSFYPVWTPFDMDILRNKEHATNRNWHWALDQHVSPKNSIISCQKYMKVVEYWHGTIKNYRYDGDVSASPSLIPARPWVGKW